MAASAPSSSASARLASVDALAITRPAPSGCPSCTATDPTPPAPECTTTLSPAAIRGAEQMPRRGALHEQRDGRLVGDRIGDRERRRRRRERILRVATAPAERDD